MQSPGQRTIQKRSPAFTTKVNESFLSLTKPVQLLILSGKLQRALSLMKTQRLSGLLSETQLRILEDLESVLGGSSTAGRPSKSTAGPLKAPTRRKSRNG